MPPPSARHGLGNGVGDLCIVGRVGRHRDDAAPAGLAQLGRGRGQAARIAHQDRHVRAFLRQISATALPMPRLPPVTSNHLPFSCRLCLVVRLV